MNNLSFLLDRFPKLSLLNIEDLKKNSNANPQSSVFYSNHWSEEESLKFIISGKGQCLLQKNAFNYKTELYTALSIQNNPLHFLKNPLESLFQGEFKALNLTFNNKSTKDNLLKSAESFLTEINSLFVHENSRIIIEELSMNAIIDAPKEALKKGYDSLPKNSELILAFDQDKLVISCLDHYGALNPLHFIEKIYNINSQGVSNNLNLNPSKGGAGIGCFLLYRYSGTLCIVVDPGKATRVTTTIPLKISQRKFELLEKNLQVIAIDSMEAENGKQRKV